VAPLIDIRSASVRYDADHALRDITISVQPGERIALVGRSGAGKSTMLRLLFERCGVESALVPQDLGLVNTLSVFHNVYMAALKHHGGFYNLINLFVPMRKEVRAIMPVLERLQLKDKIFEPVGQLSGGQRQRTSVARALHQGSQIVMADEPVSSVDEHQSRRVLDALVSTHETVVMAMHDTTLALAYSNRIIGLEDGQITLDEPSSGMRPDDLNGLYAG
jgi:phosphonate transport system ATP-binding protein